jgi:chromosomal replication initiation ATPase DnaA
MIRSVRHSTQLPLAFDHPPSYKREDFINGETNFAALAFVDAWPEGWPGKVGALWGPAGCGKTHLAHIWARAASAETLDSRTFTHETLTRLSLPGAWAMDDADLVEDPVALFHLLNFVNQSSGALLLTGREAPQNWSRGLPDLHSRLAGLPGAALAAPDEALLARVMLKLFADRQLKVPEGLIPYLVVRMERSFSVAERLVAVIDDLALEQRRNISVEIGAEALSRVAIEASGDIG